jgi:hypothetical protein
MSADAPASRLMSESILADTPLSRPAKLQLPMEGANTPAAASVPAREEVYAVYGPDLHMTVLGN